MSATPLAQLAGPIALVAGGLVIVTRLAIILTIPVDPEALRATVLTPFYAFYSVGSVAAFAILVIAAVALYEREARPAGLLGVFGVCAAIIGTVFMAGDWWYESFAVPWLADAAPVVFEIGPGGRLLVGGLTSFVLFGIGWVMYGVASLRAGVFPAAMSIAVVAGGLVSGIPIAGAYLGGGLLLGLAIVGMGTWAMRTDAATVTAP